MSYSYTEEIKKNLRTKQSDELLEIYRNNNKDEWSDEAFELIKDILLERSIPIPQQDVAIQNTTNKPNPKKGFIKENAKGILLFALLLLIIFTNIPQTTDVQTVLNRITSNNKENIYKSENSGYKTDINMTVFLIIASAVFAYLVERDKLKKFRLGLIIFAILSIFILTYTSENIDYGISQHKMLIKEDTQQTSRNYFTMSSFVAIAFVLSGISQLIYNFIKSKVNKNEN